MDTRPMPTRRVTAWSTLLLLFALAMPARATTFTVNVTDDTDDGACNVAHCSLREALTAAQSGAGAPHVIAFNIPGAGVRTITGLSTWPFITQTVTIDGYTQPGSSANTNASGAINAVPLIELRAGSSFRGLEAVNATVVIRGLIVSGFGPNITLNNGVAMTIAGSFIGTTANGLAAAAGNDTKEGVLVNGGTLTVGGLAPADRNVISGNNIGVHAALAPFAGLAVTMQGNLVGVDKNGTAAVPNRVGYQSEGCNGGNATGQIGGDTVPARNIFSGNLEAGVNIGNCGVGTFNTSNNSFVKGNFIGTAINGTSPIPNGVGVVITSGSNIVVGGLAPGEGNIIAFNTQQGVTLQSSRDGLGVLSNSIHSNGALGIDIDTNGVTPNDPGDADLNRPNFPVITSITRSVGSTTIVSTFDAPIIGEYRVQYFRSPLPDALSHGEGRTFVGQVTANANNPTVIALGGAFAVEVDAADFIAATLTDPNGNTSEFSAFIADLTLTAADAPDPVAAGQNVTYTLSVTNAADALFPSGPVAIVFPLHPNATFVSATGGITPVAGVVTVPVGVLTPGQTAPATVVVRYADPGVKQVTASVTTHVIDPEPADNTVTLDTTVTAAPTATFSISGQVRDLNDTGVPGISMVLSGSQASTIATDADGFYAFAALPAGGTYTVTPTAATFAFNPPSQTFANLQANEVASFFIAQTGTFRRYFAEGATGTFFDTSIALLNATGEPTTATVKFQREDGQVISQTVNMAGLARATILPRTLPGLEAASFSTVVESTQPVIADRTMRWDASGYGSHAETSVLQPLTRWYLAEGATTGGFNLYYLIQNATSEAATIRIEYLRPAPASPLTKTYTIGPNTRRTIYVNAEDPLLDEAEISAVITSTNDVPVVVERAMYLDSNGQLFGAGHESAAVPDLSTTWFFAEGATGPFFNMFILVANPGDADAALQAQYLLPTGEVITKTYLARAHTRLTISVHAEDPRLANAALSTTLRSTNDVAVLAERAMWWPAAPLAAQWTEGHNSAGAIRTGEKWGLADGEEDGVFSLQTYVLVANASDAPGTVQVTAILEDGTTAQLPTPLALAAHSRTTLRMGELFPAVRGTRFGVIVESLGASPAQIAVERAMYNDAVINGQPVTWAAGTNAVGTRLR